MAMAPPSTDNSGSGWTAWAGSVLAIAAIGAFDWWSGVEIRTYPLYYAPISLLAWRSGSRGALAGTVMSAASWYVSNRLGGLEYSSTGVWVANTLVQGVSFGVVGFLIAGLRGALAREQELSRTDSLTGLYNTRAFYEEARGVLDLCRRHGRPATVAYVDLDSFKSVNDRKGHKAGDDLLREVGDVLRASTRPSDLAARLGGDEFVVLLPELAAAEAAAALERLRSHLADAPSLQSSGVTATIGGATFTTVPQGLQEVVQRADARMYVAKSMGKNRVELEVVEG